MVPRFSEEYKIQMVFIDDDDNEDDEDKENINNTYYVPNCFKHFLLAYLISTITLWIRYIIFPDL